MEVVRSPTTRVRLVLAVLINLLCSVVYYGLSLNVVILKTNQPLRQRALQLRRRDARLPAHRADPRPLPPCSSSAAASLLAGIGISRVACGVLGIFDVAATYDLLFIYAAELFPTVLRNVALGCTAQVTQLGAIVAPMVVVLGEKVPFAVFGASGIAAALLVSYLPETMNKPMYDTMAGLEEAE
ncbi:hypothetical protein PR202_ga20462 [Eleusine coracana subsp. coracana]|uniref:Major facilitator superfamily (MFS) profile domain-containing protein n=1 Tax=Eleusine coracana subsp. coracana TaxID=191504 RepID=A0AAV5CWR8_ELECO|nr:hypothetical protein PR202_ga20462 [Eleusine coracana subsp. coracana]